MKLLLSNKGQINIIKVKSECNMCKHLKLKKTSLDRNLVITSVVELFNEYIPRYQNKYLVTKTFIHIMESHSYT